MNEKLSFIDFVDKLKLVKECYGVRSGSYKNIICSADYIIGERESTGNEFKINLKRLYDAYLNENHIDTFVLKNYVDRVQSPSYAILMEAGLC